MEALAATTMCSKLPACPLMGSERYNTGFTIRPQAWKSMSLSMSLQFADQSHMMFYTRASSCSKRDKQAGKTHKDLLVPSNVSICGTPVTLDVDDGSVEDVIKELEALQMRVKAKKQELKAKKKKMKKPKAKVCNKSSSSSESSSESSESSDDECGMDMDMETLRKEMQAGPSVGNCSTTENSGVIDTVATSVKSGDLKAKPVAQTAVACSKVEVCTGGKCKKNGSRQVLAAFQDNIPSNSTVVATSCKCMGKCDQGPNVRVQKGPESNPLVYSHVAPQDVETLLQQHFQVGRPPSGLPAVPMMLPSRTPSTKQC